MEWKIVLCISKLFITLKMQGKVFLKVWKTVRQENRHRQTYSCPRDWRLSASWGPNWGPPWNPPYITARSFWGDMKNISIILSYYTFCLSIHRKICRQMFIISEKIKQRKQYWKNIYIVLAYIFPYYVFCLSTHRNIPRQIVCRLDLPAKSGV